LLFRLFNRGDDLVEVGPVAGIELGMEEFAIGANFKGTAARRDERERFDAFAEFKNFGRQTDGLRRVVSDDAVFDRDLSFHSACSFPKKWYEAGRVRSRVVKPKRKAERPARAVLGKLDKPPPARRGAPLG
jgi:hypothetical protein